MGRSADAFKFALTGNKDIPFLGYNSQQDPTNLSPQYLVRGSKNVYLNNNGNVEVRPGLKRFGDLDATEDGVVASYEFETSEGVSLPIQILQSGQMRFLFDDVWYDLKKFDKTRFIFSLWWDDTDKKEEVIMVNGDSNLYMWSGGIGTVESVTASQILVKGTIDAAGSGYVTGDIITVTDANAQFTVTASGGAVSALALYKVYGTTAGGIGTATTGGTGTGLTVTQSSTPTVSTLHNPDSWLTDGFLSLPGNIIVIDGVEYPYYGISEDGTDLYLETSLITDSTSGALLYQGILTTTNKPLAGKANDFIVTLNNQLIAGSYTSKVINISFDEDYTKFTQGNDLIAGDPDFAIVDELPTGAVVKGESVYVFAGNANTYLLTPNTPVPVAQPIGGGNDALVVCTVKKQVGAGKSAAIAQEFITTLGTDVIYLSQDHQLRQLGTVRNIVTQKTPSLSKTVRQELIDEDFTGGAIRSVDEFTYLTSVVSGRTYLFQIRDDVDSVGNLTAQRLWQPPQEWGISRIAVIDGVTYGYSSSTPQLYQLWDTDQWHDDSPQDEPSPYECVARFAYENNGLETGMVGFNMCYYEGYIAPNSALTGRIRFDYLGGTHNQGQDGIQEVTISSLEEPGWNGIPDDDSRGMTLFIGQSDAEVGVPQVGVEQVGGTIDALKGFPKFRVIQDVEETDVFEYQVELYSYEADSRWSVKCFGTNATASVNNPVFLRKS